MMVFSAWVTGIFDLISINNNSIQVGQWLSSDPPMQLTWLWTKGTSVPSPSVQIPASTSLNLRWSDILSFDTDVHNVLNNHYHVIIIN